ncbi:glycoside hydrolase family 97 catalytic domain-containing protein [Pontiellaceae bacterium B1224]|nr:glycoside hydrolase family 97 catalytic domain-containing protein [Pontiellaceae bacterium B1224]
MKKVCLGLIMGLAVSGVFAADYTVKSPDGQAVVKLTCSDSALSYALSWKGEELINSSALSILDNPDYQMLDTATQTIDETWKPVWGSFSEVRDHANQLTLKLKVSGVSVELICQVYNDGVGIRFTAPAQSGLAGKSFTHRIDYQAADAFNAYSGMPGSSIPPGPTRSTDLEKGSVKKKAKAAALPYMMQLDNGPWVALLESDLYSAELFNAARFTVKPQTSILQNVAGFKPTDSGFITPWKVILFADEPGDFLINMVTLNLAAPCEIEDTSWIKPGKGLWDWRIHGYDNGDFEYGINTKSYLRQIDFCAANNIEYLTVDDFWFVKATHGKMDISPEVDIEKVVQYAKSKGVEIQLYYDEHKGKFGDDLIFKYYADLGVVGMKYGFRGNKAPFTRMAIREAANEKIAIFFHDGPTPMVGVERTMPNMISREYGHGQQDARKVFLPSTFIKMAMINGLTGPLDISNGNFGINSINAGERQKGPKIKNSYITTVVSEVARCLIINSGLVTLPDAPEEYEKKADLFSFLAQMPATWDETQVPYSKMAEYLTVVRRSGDTWFVGSVNAEDQARDLQIELDFLKPGVQYEVTLFEDTEKTDGKTNPEAYQISKQTLKSTDVVTAKMALGGGHAMILRPVK